MIPLVALVQDQLRAEQLQCALRAQLLIHLQAQGDFPAQVVGTALDGLVIGDSIAGLKKQCHTKLRRRHAWAAALAVQSCEVFIPETDASSLGQRAVERVAPDMILEEIVGAKQFPLR